MNKMLCMLAMIFIYSLCTNLKAMTPDSSSSSSIKMSKKHECGVKFIDLQSPELRKVVRYFEVPFREPTLMDDDKAIDALINSHVDGCEKKVCEAMHALLVRFCLGAYRGSSDEVDKEMNVLRRLLEPEHNLNVNVIAQGGPFLQWRMLGGGACYGGINLSPLCELFALASHQEGCKCCREQARPDLQKRAIIADWLIERGADVNLAPNKNGATALCFAVCNQDPEGVKGLREKGADINIKPTAWKGKNALEVAAIWLWETQEKDADRRLRLQAVIDALKAPLPKVPVLPQNDGENNREDYWWSFWPFYGCSIH
jgi:hypothetical protein